MSVFKIIHSLGIKGNRVIERAETSSCKHRVSRLKDCGFTDAQRKQILEMKREMKQFSTTC